MKPTRKAIAASALMFMVAAAAQAQYKTFKFDTQLQKPILLDKVFSGNTPFLKAEAYENGTPLLLNDWTLYFRYSYGQFDTNGMVSIPADFVTSNVISWVGTTNVFFKEYDKYYFAVVGVRNDGAVKTFATGRMIQDYDPAAETNITAMVGQINMDWWTNNVGAQVTSNKNAITVLETGKVSQVDYDAHVASNVVSFAGVETQKLDVATFNSYTGSVAATLTPAWSNITDKPTIMGAPSNSATITWQAVATNNEVVTYQATGAETTGKVSEATFTSYTSTQASTNAALQASITYNTTNLYRGYGTTGLVYSTSVSDAGKYWRNDGVWASPSTAGVATAFADTTGSPYDNTNLAAALTSVSNGFHGSHSGLGWAESGHTGVVSSLAGFDASGAAIDYAPSAFATAAQGVKADSAVPTNDTVYLAAITNVTVAEGTSNAVVVSGRTAALTVNTNYSAGGATGSATNWYQYPAVSTVQWDFVTSSYDGTSTNWGDDLTPTLTATSSCYGSGNIANLFDDDTNTYAQSGFYNQDNCFKFNFATSTTISRYVLYPVSNEGFTNLTWNSWDFYGSADSTNWTQIDTQTAQQDTMLSQGSWTGDVGDVTYKYYMFTNCYPDPLDNGGLSELKLYYATVTYSNLTYSTNSAFVSYDGTNMTFSDSQTTQTLAQLATDVSTGSVLSVSGDDVSTTNAGSADNPIIVLTSSVSNSLALADSALQNFSTLTGADISSAGGLTNAAAFDAAGSAAAAPGTNGLAQVLAISSDGGAGIVSNVSEVVLSSGTRLWSVGEQTYIYDASNNPALEIGPASTGRRIYSVNETGAYTDFTDGFPVVTPASNAPWLTPTSSLNAGAITGTVPGTVAGPWITEETQTVSIATSGSGNVVTNLTGSGTTITQHLGTVTGGGGAQSPWTNTIDAAGYGITNQGPSDPFVVPTVLTSASDVTFSRSNGNLLSLVVTNSPCTVTPASDWATNGAAMVGLQLYIGTNTTTLTNSWTSFATAPTLSTNAWNFLIYLKQMGTTNWTGRQ